ncbi:MAG: SpoIIE family protein phosphatase [Atopobiaceae bacterium]|nr:SpoIIE family protein phosphatase [Atopobiaceae bacterium]
MKKRRHIQQILIRGIALIVLATLTAALLVASIMLSQRSMQQASELLSGHLRDVSGQVVRMVEDDVMALMARVASFDEGTVVHYADNEQFKQTVKGGQWSVVELVDERGEVLNSTDDARVGLSYQDNAQTKAFLDEALKGGFVATSVDSWPLYNGARLHLFSMRLPDDGGDCIVVVGCDEASYDLMWRFNLAEGALYRRIGERGYLVYCTDELFVLGTMESKLDGTQITLAHDPSKVAEEGLMVEERLLDKDMYVRALRVTGPNNLSYYLLATYPVEEAQRSLRRTQLALLAYAGVLFVGLLFLLGRLMRRHVSSRVETVNRSLGALTNGALDERVHVRDSIEFAELSDGINATVAKLEDLIEQEAHRLDTELVLARTIQKTSLPSIFPPFPERRDFGLFASMDTAKEVGGDFYDFFLISDDQLAFIVADVSDKGIPAALFMMRAKAAIKALAVSGLPADEVMRRANDDLYANNEAGMFVTVWLGMLDLVTGVVEYVHAGHTCPALIGKEGVSIVRQRRDFIVGARSGMSYHRQELRLAPGDALFLYSDGVTEAFDADGEMYGSEGLERALANAVGATTADDPNVDCKALCLAVRDDVAAFAKGTEQSDDITMLCIRFEGTA